MFQAKTIGGHLQNEINAFELSITRNTMVRRNKFRTLVKPWRFSALVIIFWINNYPFILGRFVYEHMEFFLYSRNRFTPSF